MPPPSDTSRRVRLLRRALDLGLLLEEEVVPSGGHADETLGEERLAEIFDQLVAEGRLDPAQLVLAGGPERDLEENPSLDRLAYLAPPEPDSTLMLAEFPLPKGDRYLPLAYLGDGGMGRVFKAWDQQLHRVVALKFLKRTEPEAVQRFLHEARSQAQLDHPNVCRVYSVGQSHGQAFLAMQFIEGPTLRTALPQLNLEQIAAIIRDVAEALHACHRLGILHRDIKPSNIMLERTDRMAWHPFLMDFGLARELASDSDTVSGVIVGTPVYASPEQVQGRSEDLDRRSDVYSLGATLFECLCGEPPFPFGGSLADLARRIVEQEPADPRKRVRSLPRDLGTIVLKCLDKDPNRRFDSARPRRGSATVPRRRPNQGPRRRTRLPASQADSQEPRARGGGAGLAAHHRHPGDLGRPAGASGAAADPVRPAAGAGDRAAARTAGPGLCPAHARHPPGPDAHGGPARLDP